MTVLARILAVAVLVGAAPAPTSASDVVSAPAGAVRGVLERGVRVFKGVPYARPPVGPLRWRPPEALPAWTGVRAADAFGPACVQPPSPPGIYHDPPPRMAEDCLHLNVWAPRNARGLPVLVWIHGGALSGGYGHQTMYDGAALAKRGLVVVTINYRLGPLGYLAHPALSAESPDGLSGNYGLLDQVAALRWVRDNVAAFGSDPGAVTVAGESAGALSVMYLMATPAARGLFGRAILQSPYMVSTPALKEARLGAPAAEATGLKVASALGAADLKALRAMDATAVTAGAAKAGYIPWGTVDGKLFPRQLVETFDRGEQAPVPLIAGFNSGEIRSLRMLAPPAPASAAAYEAAIRERYGDLADAFLRLYPSRDPQEAVLAAPRDALYGWTAERLARAQAARGLPTYLYLFDHGYPAADEVGLHAFHAAEIPYVFGTTDRVPAFWPKILDKFVERRLASAMGGYWSSFARTGVPAAEGQPRWAPYGRERASLVFAGTARPAARLMPGMYELHEAATCRRRAAGLPWNWNTGIASPVLPQSAGCP